MKLYDQTTFSNGVDHGDCVRACIATILQIDPATLPHPIAGNGAWSSRFHRDLRTRGWVVRTTDYHADDAPARKINDASWAGYEVPMLVMACGPTVRSKTLHAVVWDRAEVRMIHDPHPSREGLLQIDSYQYLAPYPPRHRAGDFPTTAEKDTA